MKTKVLLLIFVYLSFGFYSSCCKAPIPYFDFAEFSIRSSDFEEEINNVNVYLGVSLDINYTDLQFYSNNNLNVFSSAFAMQPCPTNGNRGAKFPITKIDVTCNQTFNKTINPNELINQFVFYYDYKDTVSKMKSINDNVILERLNASRDDYRITTLSIYQDDTLDLDYVFTIKLTKSNGDVVVSESEPIRW